MPKSPWDDLNAALHEFLYLPDASHVQFLLATAVSNWAEGEPLWGMLVGAPGSGKTEAIRLLDDVVDAHVVDITAAGLLSYSGGRKPQVTGLLPRVGNGRVFVTISDFSSMLATTDRSDTGRLLLLSVLRSVWDGRLVRDLGNAPEPLVWEGRFTVCAAATPAIDRTSSHANALGPRWLFIRLPDGTPESRRRIARAAVSRPRERPGLRLEARRIATELVRAGAAALPTVAISDELVSTLLELAIVTSLGRASIERDYGTRGAGFAVPEDPGRVVGQLQHLAKALVALGLTESDAAFVCRRAAVDSMPASRGRVLRQLSEIDGLSVADLARRTGLHPTSVSNVLYDLVAIGVAGYRGRNQARSHKAWVLDGEEAELIRRAFSFESPTDTKCGKPQSPPTTSPRGEPHEPEGSHTSRLLQAPPGGGGGRHDMVWALIDDYLGDEGASVVATVEHVAASFRSGSPDARHRRAERAIGAGVKKHRYAYETRGDETFVYRQSELPLGQGEA